MCYTVGVQPSPRVEQDNPPSTRGFSFAYGVVCGNISGMKKRTRFTPNIYFDAGDHYEFTVYGNETGGCVELGRVKISKDDLYEVGKHKWGIDGRGYVRNRLIKIHQLILGVRYGFDIDHVNGDKLDNRRQNLRHVTHSVNMMNIHKKNGGTVGVFWDKSRSKWRASIMVNGKNHYIGRFRLHKTAVSARREYEKRFFV